MGFISCINFGGHSMKNINSENSEHGKQNLSQQAQKNIPDGWLETLWLECWDIQAQCWDITGTNWQQLSAQEQSQLAVSYQQWYANYCGYPLEKIIPLPTLSNADIPLVMKLIPPGRFLMGAKVDESESFLNEHPQHKVWIQNPFYSAIYPCTQAQYMAVMGDNPFYFQHAGRDAPAENITWTKAMKFCESLGCILPPESVWEMMCRAGTTGMSYIGNFEILTYYHAPALSKIAWYGGNSGVAYEGGYHSSYWQDKEEPHNYAGTHPVGKKNPNSWGLYDTLGNVLEWCLDGYRVYSSEDYTETWLPITPKSPQDSRMVRGGSWRNIAHNVRISYRLCRKIECESANLGFRVCSLIEPTKK